MAKMNDAPVSMNNVSQISAGTSITGDIDCGGDLRIDGTINGTLRVKGKIVIGSAGKVEGELVCRNSDISGHMKGKVRVQEQLSLKATSVFEGDIVTKRLSIEPGSQFTGTCRMGDAALDEHGSPDNKKA